MAGVRVVQAFVRADYENERFEKENKGLQDAATAAQRAAAFLNPALLFVINLGLAGALWVGGDLVIDGTIELGSVFVLLNYLVAVMIPLILLAVLLPQMASADSSVRRVLDVLEEVPDVQDKPDAPTLTEAVGGAVQGRVAFEDVTLLLHRRGRQAEPEAGAQRHRPRRRARPGGRVPRRDRLRASRRSST